jgi:hypothetical protein
MAFAGECWTLSISESPSVVEDCSLSAVLQTTGDLSKYFLSQKAASGILRRAERRNKKLPQGLRQALTSLANDPVK